MDMLKGTGSNLGVSSCTNHVLSTSRSDGAYLQEGKKHLKLYSAAWMDSKDVGSDPLGSVKQKPHQGHRRGSLSIGSVPVRPQVS